MHKKLKAQKEELGYIQGQINKITNWEDRQLWIAWGTVNDESGGKSSLRAKLKAANQKKKNTQVGRIFQKSALKPSENH